MCLHVSVDFSSVFVVINLQTWVLLLDYLGIGVPTPPSTPPPFQPEEKSSVHAPPPSWNENIQFSPVFASMRTQNLIDDSLFTDAKDMLSLESNSDFSLLSMNSSQFSNDCEDTGWMSGKVGSSIGDSQHCSGGLLSSVQDDYSGIPSFSTLNSGTIDQQSSVWGVEGKLSAKVKLNLSSLTVTFNKPEHPLARGSVSVVTAEVKLTKGNLELSGALGQGSVIDMTGTGTYYRER